MLESAAARQRNYAGKCLPRRRQEIPDSLCERNARRETDTALAAPTSPLPEFPVIARQSLKSARRLTIGVAFRRSHSAGIMPIAVTAFCRHGTAGIAKYFAAACASRENEF